jgi:hypothetical protein
MRLLTPLILALLVSACGDGTGSGDDFREDRFADGALSAYTLYSDGGNPWSVSGGTLRGNGLALQSVLVRKGDVIRDGWVEAVADSMDDGGLVLRFSGPNRYYVLAMRDDAAPFPFPLTNLQIYEKSGPGQAGFREVWTYDATWPRGASRTVRFESAGDSLRVYLNGTRVGSVAAPARPEDGTGFGVRHYGDAPFWITRYRRLRWSER